MLDLISLKLQQAKAEFEVIKKEYYVGQSMGMGQSTTYGS